MFLFVITMLFIGTGMYGADQHLVYVYTGAGYSGQQLDIRKNIYDTPNITTGVAYRSNKFLSKWFINFFSIGLSLSGGIVFPKRRGNLSLLHYNSFLDLELFFGYGVVLVKNKEHQLSILGLGFVAKFYGLLERISHRYSVQRKVE